MAVALVSEPTGVVTLDSPDLCYCFALSDIGTETTSIELAWQLCINGEAVTDIIIQKPKAVGEPMYIRPLNLIESRLRTTIPSLNTAAITTDPTFKADIQIKFGEALFDDEDCENNVAEVGQQSETATVINTWCQLWEGLSFLPEVFPLANLPKYVTMCEGTYDWLWLCNSTITVNVTYNGGSMTSNEYTATDAQYIAVGTANIEVGVGLPGVDPRDTISCIQIYGSNQFGSGALLSTINVVPCCCTDDCRVDLYFLDAKGSWRAVGGFKCIESRQSEFTGTVICKEMPCNVSYDVALREYGNTFLRKKGFTKVTFKQKIRITCNNQEYYEAFGASGHYMIRVGRSNTLMRFIATTRDIPTYKDNDLTEITFSGYYSHEYRGHRVG